MKQHNFKALDSQAVSSTTVYTGAPSQIGGMVAASYQYVWTGTCVGTIAIEVSNDYDQLRGTGTWTEVNASHFFPALAAVSPRGVAGSTFVDLPEIASRWVRPKYTNASSTGVLSISFAGKGY